MTRKQITFPAKGRIKATGAAVTITGKARLAGIEVYHVRFEDGFETDWAVSKVIVEGPA